MQGLFSLGYIHSCFSIWLVFFPVLLCEQKLANSYLGSLQPQVSSMLLLWLHKNLSTSFSTNQPSLPFFPSKSSSKLYFLILLNNNRRGVWLLRWWIYLLSWTPPPSPSLPAFTSCLRWREHSLPKQVTIFQPGHGSCHVHAPSTVSAPRK